jgi:hypothetical protein
MVYLDALYEPKENAAHIMSRKGALTNVLFDLPYPLGAPYLITCTAFHARSISASTKDGGTNQYAYVKSYLPFYSQIFGLQAARKHIIIPSINRISK